MRGIKNKIDNQDIQTYIETRLSHWAEWVLKEKLGCKGYPNKSIIAELMKMGCIIKTKGKLIFPLSYDENAEEIEQCVKKMAEQKPQLAKALRIQYLYKGTIHQKARKMNTSDTEFKIYARMAKQWIAGWFAHVVVAKGKNYQKYCLKDGLIDYLQV